MARFNTFRLCFQPANFSQTHNLQLFIRSTEADYSDAQLAAAFRKRTQRILVIAAASARVRICSRQGTEVACAEAHHGQKVWLSVHGPSQGADCLDVQIPDILNPRNHCSGLPGSVDARPKASPQTPEHPGADAHREQDWAPQIEIKHRIPHSELPDSHKQGPSLAVIH